MNRTRLILLLLILVVLVAVVVLVVLPALNPAPAPVTTTDTGADTVAQVVQSAQETPLPTATPIVYVDIVIAIQEIRRGQVITPASVALVPYPEEAAPFNAIFNLEDVEGRLARTDIFREQPVLSNMIVDSFQSLARVGSDAAAVLPNGLVGIALPIDRLTSVAYGVADGDRVDLIISLLFVDVDEIFQTIEPNTITLYTINPEDGSIEIQEGIEGRLDSTSIGPVIVGPSERQRPRLVSQMIVQDALVVHVGNFPMDGRFIGIPPTPTPEPIPTEEGEEGTPPPPTPTPARPDIITLGVTPQEAVVLTWLVEARVPVTLALRSATDTSRTPTNEVSLDYIMTTYGMSLPPRAPFSIEPAITSIRQLMVGDEITLNPDATG